VAEDRLQREDLPGVVAEEHVGVGSTELMRVDVPAIRGCGDTGDDLEGRGAARRTA
jgi:hypothetical protein